MSLNRIVPLEPSKALKTRVYEALRDLIGHMDIYSSQEPIRLDERALGDQLGVSRTPVREAISRLEQEGLVQNIARRGAFVVRKTKAEILDIVDVWAALESMAARLITENATDQEIASLRALFATMEDDIAQANIDEYSEMIDDNPEYRAELDSITRVGRAQGVNLILASQRPKGVSDQMRANIKLRLCLRVEEMDTSREMLRRPDAALLPNGLPGRGYLQIGNETLELLQVSWTGEKMPDDRPAAVE